METQPRVLQDLAKLKHLTEARIGLKRAGSSLASNEVLKFDLDHARARDAVHLAFQPQALAEALKPLAGEAIELVSAAGERMTYLQRPDLGRKLSQASRERLVERVAAGEHEAVDVCILVGDGLSSTAIQQNAVPFLEVLLPKLHAKHWSVSPLHFAHQARVALADEVGELYRAKIGIILIGERPGLSAANSMGIYMTYEPKVGRTDAERNCLSNIRPGGQSYEHAAALLIRLMDGALVKKVSGVDLKDDQQADTVLGLPI